MTDATHRSALEGISHTSDDQPPDPHPLRQGKERSLARAMGNALLGISTEPRPPVVLEAAGFLGLEYDDVGRHGAMMPTLLGKLLLHSLAALAESNGLELRSAEGDQATNWHSLELSEGSVAHPDSAMLCCPAGLLADTPLVICLKLTPSERGYWVEVAVPRRLLSTAHRVLNALIVQAQEDNPLRNSFIHAGADQENLTLDARPWPTTDRGDLVMPDDLWAAVDLGVHRHLDRAEQLAALDLGQRHGMLLHGPPGTGKSHICRIIAAELRGKATVIVADRSAVASQLHELYAYATRLAPSIVMLEDVDLVAHQRSGGSGGGLQSLLVELDGIETVEAPVITIATTNAPWTLDEAARRSARLEQHIEVPPPAFGGRRLIFQRYLNGLRDTDFDLRRLALTTDGATGADIRSIVRRALLTNDGDLTTEMLVEAARELGWGRRQHHATYL